MAFATINKLELGHRPAHLITIRKLAEALGVEPTELMKEQNCSGQEETGGGGRERTRLRPRASTLARTQAGSQKLQGALPG